MAEELASNPANREGYYVYAIARPHCNVRCGELAMEGIVPNVAIETIGYKDILAVLSPVPLTQFSQSALEQKLQETAWVRDRVIAHQAVLAGLLKGYTIVPLKFCTVYLCKDRVLNSLDAGYTEFDQTLRQLQGATEWGLKVYCNLSVFAKQIEESSEALRAQRDATQRAKPGTAYFLRKKLEQAALREAEQLVTTKVQEIHARLSAYARGSVLNKAESASEYGHTGEMFMNGAYLVTDTDWPCFRAALDALTSLLGSQGFELELTGPWPPYNFATNGRHEDNHG